MRKKSALPSWANLKEIKQIYKEAANLRDSGKNVHVDHIIPLNGKNVCGLHIEYNLQIIDSNDNLKKSNNWSNT